MSSLFEEHEAEYAEPSSTSLLDSLDQLQQNTNPFCLYLLNTFASASSDNLALFQALVSPQSTASSAARAEAAAPSYTDATVFIPAFRSFLDDAELPDDPNPTVELPKFATYAAVASVVALIQSELLRLRSQPGRDVTRMFWDKVEKEWREKEVGGDK
ncbi:hypothetical protein JCM11641_008424 [Rhodosporidiobolus odoratus]